MLSALNACSQLGLLVVHVGARSAKVLGSLLQRAAASGGGGSRTMGCVSHCAVSLVAVWRWCLGEEERALYEADSEVRPSI